MALHYTLYFGALITVLGVGRGLAFAAVHQLLLLEDEPALLAAEWLKDASTRLAVDKAIASIMTRALDQLAASEQKN